MDAGLPQPLSDETLRRAEALDALDAVLPFGRRDFLAGILTDGDVETLRHLAKEGMGENSLRALASDLGYLEAWCQAATGDPLPWPAPVPLLVKFVAHHLWDPAKRETDPSHGMPQDVAAALKDAGLLRVDGPHAPIPSAGGFRAGRRSRNGAVSKANSTHQGCAAR